MARKLSDTQIRVAQGNILSGSTFEIEAGKLGVSTKSMKDAIASLYHDNGGTKNKFYKNVVNASRANAEKLRKAGKSAPVQNLENDPAANRQKKSAARRRTNATAIHVDACTPAPQAQVTPQTDDAKLATILAKRKTVCQNIAVLKDELSEAKAKVGACEGPVAEAKAALRKAQDDVNAANEALSKAKEEAAAIQSKINAEEQKKHRLDQEAQQLKEKYLFLVAPGYTGSDYPTCGIFISTENVNDRVTVQAPTSLFDLDLQEMEKAGYDSLKEYRAALAFVALVSWAKHQSNKEYRILVTDERIQTLITLRCLD